MTTYNIANEYYYMLPPLVSGLEDPSKTSYCMLRRLSRPVTCSSLPPIVFATFESRPCSSSIGYRLRRCLCLSPRFCHCQFISTRSLSPSVSVFGFPLDSRSSLLSPSPLFVMFSRFILFSGATWASLSASPFITISAFFLLSISGVLAAQPASSFPISAFPLSSPSVSPSLPPPTQR